MKNKLRMIDINFASMYMGRFLTLGVTALVLAITISALTGAGGLRNHRPLVLEVPGSGGAGEALVRFQPLRDLLALETGRAVRVQVRGDQWSGDCDLFVFPVGEFLRAPHTRDLVPIYSIEPLKQRRNTAVLVARTKEPVSESPPAANAVMFSHPRSLNGFWLQLEMLESEGFRVPERIQSLRFAETPGAGTRVVYSVAMGQSDLGACRASDLADAVREGGIARGELSIVHSRPSLPEVVVACRTEDVDYYRLVLARTAARMAVPEPAGRWQDAVALLDGKGMRSLRPISEEELERAAALHEKMEERIRGGQ
jgi:hypothetical protein